MAKILITGSAGFIGRNVHKALAQKHEVVGLEIYGYDPAPLKEYDGIIHLAAVSRVSAGEANPVKCLQTNIIETAKVLEIPHKWFIFASTCEPTHNVYGYSKRAAEDYIKLRSPKHVILRLVNVYGTGMQEDKLLPLLSRGEATKISKNVLPFEHIHVDNVVERIVDTIKEFDWPAFKSYTMKLSTGTAYTTEELGHVAASY